MGHQYPFTMSQPHHQAPHNFSSATASRQQAYFHHRTTQAVRQQQPLPVRVVRCRPQFYQSPHNQHLAYSTRGVHMLPDSTVSQYTSEPFEQFYDEPAYNSHKFLIAAAYPEDEQHVASYDYDERQQHIFSQDQSRLGPVCYEQEFIDQHQQQQRQHQIQPMINYVGEAYAQVASNSYCDEGVSIQAITHQQHLLPRILEPSGRLSEQDGRQLSMPHQHYHPANRISNNPTARQQMFANAGEYFRYDMQRALASLSDESQHQYAVNEPQQSLRTDLVQNLARPGTQLFYGQPPSASRSEHLGQPASSLSASSSPGSIIIPSQNLPLRNDRQQDMIVDNGPSSASSVASAVGTADAYAAGKCLLHATTTTQLSSISESLMNIPFGNEPIDVQQQSLSMLSERNVITSPTAAVSRDTPPEASSVVPPLPPLSSSPPPVQTISMVSMSEGSVIGEDYVNQGDLTGTSTRKHHLRSRPTDIDGAGFVEYSRDTIGCTYTAAYEDSRECGTPQAQRSQAMQQFADAYRPSPPPPPQEQARLLSLPSNGKNQKLRATAANDTNSDNNNGNNRQLVAPPLASNPKTNPAEYLDMTASGGNISQDWLDTICSHLIEHMNSFGICVIDNFLGSIKGELILNEVHRLYSHGRHSKGRLVSNKLKGQKQGVEAGDGGRSSSSSPSSSSPSSDTTSDDNSSASSSPSTVVKNNGQAVGQQRQQSQHRLQGTAADATGTIRSDRVIWVDGCEDGCAEINNLIQTLCSVITNSSRLSLYSNNGLDKVNINKRTKAHVACYPGSGTRYIKHVDNPNGDGRVITAIYYLNKNWNTKRDGGLLRMFPAGMDEVANIEPLFDRALFFWSDRRNPHEVLPSFRDRFAITVWYIGESRP